MPEGLEEYMFEEDEIENDKAIARTLQIVTDNLGKTSFKDKLKSNSSLFVEMRDNFARKFPHKSEEIENTALGVLPWFHRNHMIGSFGALLRYEGYIPSFKRGGFEDGRANFMEAEIWVPSKGNYCENIISLFPYSHAAVPEFNQLQEEFCDNREVIQAMFGHELGEIVLDDEANLPYIDPIHLLIRSPQAIVYEEEERRQMESRHRKLDYLMVDVGLGDQTKKMFKFYRDKAQDLTQIYESSTDYYVDLEETVKMLDERISKISNYSKSKLDSWLSKT
jgi:hypothetical protein